MMPRAFIPNASWARTDDRRYQPQPSPTSSRPILPGSLTTLTTATALTPCCASSLYYRVGLAYRSGAPPFTIRDSGPLSIHPSSPSSWLPTLASPQLPPPGRVRRVDSAVCLAIAREDSGSLSTVYPLHPPHIASFFLRLPSLASFSTSICRTNTHTHNRILNIIVLYNFLPRIISKRPHHVITLLRRRLLYNNSLLPPTFLLLQPSPTPDFPKPQTFLITLRAPKASFKASAYTLASDYSLP